MNHHVNSLKKVITLCFLQKLRTQELMLSHLQRLEDLMMDFFLSVLIPGQYLYTGAPVDTGDQSLR